MAALPPETERARPRRCEGHGGVRDGQCLGIKRVQRYSAAVVENDPQGSQSALPLHQNGVSRSGRRVRGQIFLRTPSGEPVRLSSSGISSFIMEGGCAGNYDFRTRVPTLTLSPFPSPMAQGVSRVKNRPAIPLSHPETGSNLLDLPSSFFECPLSCGRSFQPERRKRSPGAAIGPCRGTTASGIPSTPRSAYPLSFEKTISPPR